MRDYYLKVNFEYRPEVILATTAWVERTIRVRAESALAAAHDGEHVCNGYRLGTGLRAELVNVGTATRGPYLETPNDFKPEALK